ncbi:unnamed protein product [Oncorhynchus mykiss]|uniref:RETREG1-3/ARL6IP-like N-terminal reticulon-homology domain-containing protein n=1 Tax=Oncorhynchus mykiss TaxID=8022 RepID=A0A060YJW4_ONCMY|nr:unnamed protein product [Oncorhynchus mykiss]
MAAAGHEEEQAVIADCRISNVINWNKPFRTTTLFAATTAVYWFVALNSYRAYCLLALSLALMGTVLLVKDVALSRCVSFSKGM